MKLSVLEGHEITDSMKLILVPAKVRKKQTNKQKTKTTKKQDSSPCLYSIGN